MKEMIRENVRNHVSFLENDVAGKIGAIGMGRCGDHFR